MSGWQHWQVTQLSESESEIFIRSYSRPRRPLLRPYLVAVAEATWNVYESSADDFDELEFVRDANQQDWSQDCKILALTQSDPNNFPKWLDEVRAAHKIRTHDGDLGGAPT